jgi:hypothetical protein
VAAIGMGLIWFGYWAGLSGVSLVKGWNNSPLGLANPVSMATFTTQCYTGSGIFPSGKSGDSGSCGGGSSASSGTPTTTDIKKGQVAGANPVIVAVAGRGK